MVNKTSRKPIYRAPKTAAAKAAADPHFVPASVTGQSAVATIEQSGVPRWLRQSGVAAWATIGILLLVSGIVFATAQISPVFIAIFIALVFASLLTPMVNRLSKYMARGLAVLLSLLFILAIFGGLIAFIVTSVASQWSKLAQQLSNGVDMIVDFLESTPLKISLTSDEVYKWMSDSIETGQQYITNNWQDLAGRVLSNVGGMAIFFTIFALGIFVTVFFLLSGSQMWRWFLNLLPTEKRPIWNHAAQAGWGTFAGYARGTLIIAFIDGLLAWVFLEILKVPLAPALGVLVMIGALIPLVGAPAAMVVAMIVALATDGVWTAVIVGIGIALIGQLEGHVFQPLIMGKQVALHPVVIGIGVVAGTLLAGLLGAIIAIPIISVSWAVFSSLYRKDPPIEGELPDVYGNGNSGEPSSEEKGEGFIKRILGKFGKSEEKALQSTS